MLSDQDPAFVPAERDTINGLEHLTPRLQHALESTHDRSGNELSRSFGAPGIEPLRKQHRREENREVGQLIGLVQGVEVDLAAMFAELIAARVDPHPSERVGDEGHLGHEVNVVERCVRSIQTHFVESQRQFEQGCCEDEAFFGVGRGHLEHRHRTGGVIHFRCLAGASVVLVAGDDGVAGDVVATLAVKQVEQVRDLAGRVAKKLRMKVGVAPGVRCFHLGRG